MALNVAEEIAPLDWINGLSHDATTSELLSHNDPPSPLQTPMIREYLHTLSLPQQKLHAVIEVLERSLDLLRDRACLLDALHTQYTGFLSPVRRLPSEVLAIIFGYLSLHSELRSAMHVCRKWFAVGDVLCPHVWSNITDTIFHSGDESNVVSRWAVALRRAHPYPLTLRLVPAYPLSHWAIESQYIAHAACQMLISRAEQWDSLETVLGNGTDIAWIHGRFERLRVLHLSGNPQADFSRLDSFDAFAAAPKLEHVTLRGFSSDVYFRLPYARLVSLTKHDSHSSEPPPPSIRAHYIMALKSSSKFQTFIWTYPPVLEVTSDDLGTARSIKPSVRVLSVTDPVFVKGFSFPSLTHLTVGDDLNEVPVDMCSSICAMLQHSRCPLVVLEINEVLLCNSLIPTLHALTSLESFSMHLSRYWDSAHNDILKWLVQHLGPEHASFLPVLGDFRLRLQNWYGRRRGNHLDYSFINDELVDVVRYRLKDTPLKRITLIIEVVYGEWPLTDAAEEELASFPGVTLRLFNPQG